jgi:hypothetical protein
MEFVNEPMPAVVLELNIQKIGFDDKRPPMSTKAL